MKLKFVVVAMLAAMFSVSAAIAAPPEGKGKPPATGDGCKPKVTVVLKGTLVSASTDSLSMNVTRSNRWGRAYVTAGSASVTVDEKTKVRGKGMKTVADLAELKAGDRVLVQARACKADLAEAATPLTAVRVVAHPAKS
jgi:hypothetical protein